MYTISTLYQIMNFNVSTWYLKPLNIKWDHVLNDILPELCVVMNFVFLVPPCIIWCLQLSEGLSVGGWEVKLTFALL